MTDRFLRDLPKVQLHCHLEGTLQPATFIDLARKHGVALTYRRGEAAPQSVPATPDPARVYDFATFNDFLMTFAAVSRSLATPEDYRRLAYEYVEDALSQNVVRSELFVSPSVWQFFHPDIDVRACVRAMRGEFDRVRDRLIIALIFDVTRNFGVERAMATAVQAADLQDLGVIGIGLGGDEAKFPAELFEDVFAFAAEQGLYRVAHAGEAAGAQSVQRAVELLGAQRIGHGLRAIDDPNVVDLLARARIPLEVCPTSNMRTGVAKRDEPHALVELDRRGCIVTIDADDPALFRTSITDEYAYVEGVTSRETLLRFVRNAIDAAFADQSQKAALHSRLEAYLTHVRT
ncbi:MAG TPA: adenosine deaminase [Candidatus Baltobacteraceae bacterium]|jgi:adenosine deaminase|nr:adenosine deaminase [Candidatus Baltobacteraceae bacterium]